MRRSLRSWLWRVPIDQEVDEEIAFHIEMRTRELVARGVDPKTARDIVLSRVGDMRRLRRTCVDLGRRREREMRVTRWLGELRDDVRFAVRQLRSAPAFTLVAAITLALGIGANGAMFALADATLLRPLPYANADRLAMVWGRTPRIPRTGVSPTDLDDLQKQNQTFEALAAIMFGAGGGPLVEAPDGSLQSAERQTVTARFFDVLGITPVAGRTFRPADAERGAAPVVVMSEGLWRRRFGADPAVIGHSIRLNGQPFAVIGIVRDDVQLQRPASIWSLVSEAPESGSAPPNLPRSARFMQVIGRLKAGVTMEAAQADLAVVADRLGGAYPDTNKDWGVYVEPLRTGVMGRDLRMTEAFVRRHLAGRDPIGMRVVIGPAIPGFLKPEARAIVGVVRQLKERMDEQEAPLQVYVPLTQLPFPDTYLVVQASSGPVQSLITPIRDAIARIDKDVPVRRERTLTDLANLTTAPHRFRAVMVGTFAALALALAMVGIFGVLAYSVEQRARELGVRIALGATTADVLRLIVGGAARMVGVGAAIGLAAAAALAQTISSFLFGVRPLDPATFASVAALLVLTATVAAAAPAWRATRVDPVEAFRSE